MSLDGSNLIIENQETSIPFQVFLVSLVVPFCFYETFLNSLNCIISVADKFLPVCVTQAISHISFSFGN